MNKKESSCAVFLDLIKAFDTVNHDILLQKLEKMGIRGELLKWFSSYLEKKSQQGYINGIKSMPLKVKHGVPQGSVLGHLLFLIYVNDMPGRLKNLYTLFADDACLFLSHRDPKVLETLVNTELEKVNEWLTNNKLTLNVDKSCLFYFQAKNKT